jgi:hypothetical protein
MDTGMSSAPVIYLKAQVRKEAVLKSRKNHLSGLSVIQRLINEGFEFIRNLGMAERALLQE